MRSYNIYCINIRCRLEICTNCLRWGIQRLRRVIRSPPAQGRNSLSLELAQIFKQIANICKISYIQVWIGQRRRQLLAPRRACSQHGTHSLQPQSWELKSVIPSIQIILLCSLSPLDLIWEPELPSFCHHLVVPGPVEAGTGHGVSRADDGVHLLPLIYLQVIHRDSHVLWGIWDNDFR